jgi:hypothetical protein
MNWLEMRVRHGIRPLFPVLMLVILPNHLRTLEWMVMGAPPKIIFDFDIDTSLKHGSLLVKRYEPRKIWVYMCVLRTHLLNPSSYVFERRSRLFIPAIEKETCRKIWWGVYTDRMLAFAPLPPSDPTRFMPRLMRSMTDRATPVREDRNVENAARAPCDPALPIDGARWVSIDNIYQRHSPASPLETQQPLPPLPYAEHHRRVATSRLATPARFGAHAPASSRLLRAALPSSSALPGTWDKDSSSRALAHHRLLGPQQTAWSVHAPARMGFSRDAPRLSSALAILHVIGIVASAWVAERRRE